MTLLAIAGNRNWIVPREELSVSDAELGVVVSSGWVVWEGEWVFLSRAGRELLGC